MMDRHRGDRDRDRDRDRDYRDRDRNRNFHHRRPSRFSDGPPLDNRRSPSSFRVRSIDSSPRDSGNFHPPPGDGGAFHPPMGGPPGGFWPMGPDVGGGFGNDFMGPPRPMMPPQSQPPPQQQPQPPSLSGQKRGFPFSARGGSPDTFDGKSFVKLFVGSVPRTVTEDEIRPLFEEQGKVLEIALIKDKRTGQQQGMSFRVLNFVVYITLLSGLLLCCAGDGSKCKLCFVSVSFCNIIRTVDFGCDLSFKSALSNKKKQGM